jgi:hypothetical protein
VPSSYDKNRSDGVLPCVVLEVFCGCCVHRSGQCWLQALLLPFLWGQKLSDVRGWGLFGLVWIGGVAVAAAGWAAGDVSRHARRACMEIRVPYVLLLLLGAESSGAQYWWRAARVETHSCIS